MDDNDDQTYDEAYCLKDFRTSFVKQNHSADSKMCDNDYVSEPTGSASSSYEEPAAAIYVNVTEEDKRGSESNRDNPAELTKQKTSVVTCTDHTTVTQLCEAPASETAMYTSLANNKSEDIYCKPRTDIYPRKSTPGRSSTTSFPKFMKGNTCSKLTLALCLLCAISITGLVMSVVCLIRLRNDTTHPDELTNAKIEAKRHMAEMRENFTSRLSTIHSIFTIDLNALNGELRTNFTNDLNALQSDVNIKFTRNISDGLNGLRDKLSDKFTRDLNSLKDELRIVSGDLHSLRTELPMVFDNKLKTVKNDLLLTFTRRLADITSKVNNNAQNIDSITLYLKRNVSSLTASIAASNRQSSLVEGRLQARLQVLSANVTHVSNRVQLGRYVRLRGTGATTKQGRVEVLLNGQWGTVCDDGWDINDATVVCRQLGYSRALSAPQDAAYGRGSGPILMDDVYCNGNENRLNQCNFITDHNCGHHEDAGVSCA